MEDTDDEDGGHARPRRETSGAIRARPSQPLLANIYMRRFVLGWKMFGLSEPRSRLVTYADDLVIL